MPARPDVDALSEHLRLDPLFSGLDAAPLQHLARSAVCREYAAGEIVFLEGETAPGLYYLQWGWLKVVMTSVEGREQVLRFLGPGELFNPIGAFTNRANPATAIALEPAGVWLLRRETMGRLLREWPDLSERAIANMADRLVHLTALVEDLSLRSVSGRLARLLLDSAQGDKVPRPRWYTQAELAAQLGTVPDMINRALRRLIEEGLVSVERHEFRILDPGGLRRHADAER